MTTTRRRPKTKNTILRESVVMLALECSHLREERDEAWRRIGELEAKTLVKVKVDTAALLGMLIELELADDPADVRRRAVPS